MAQGAVAWESTVEKGMAKIKKFRFFLLFRKHKLLFWDYFKHKYVYEIPKGRGREGSVHVNDRRPLSPLWRASAKVGPG